jgi:signal transduction histidine kinase
MQIAHSDFQDQLVRGLTHRMNNILTLFHGYLGMILDNKDLDKATVEGLTKIKLNAAQASELMDRTHSLVRPTSTVWRAIPIGEYIRTMRPVFESFLGPRTEILYNIEESLPPIQGDATRVKTAVLEIVKNACEATFASGGRVQIGVHCETPRGQRTKWIVITVADDGPGIPEDIFDKVFTPFFSTKKKQNAAGLGLTVAQSFIQLHKGNLKLESEPGCTVAEIRIPVVE